MSSANDAADTAGVDRPATVCDRCGDRLPEDRVIRLSSDPCPALADRYEGVAETCCPDCIAGIGMLAFTAEARAFAETRS
ncbi:hypothetical protein [Natrarchaeobius oligotrophus]|uniref:Uncharacterized protein n=1 Tax=Natrarchaeobius chitinivorans TaxID=1679083 RepID=A0A3N6NQ47_NATCH|nr:hypothetical protein [Natrarchaeobius chitinivorans]RQH01913.1 hypothetical protein EA472_06305 [Natrarchaeobius chitinivorans]